MMDDVVVVCLLLVHGIVAPTKLLARSKFRVIMTISKRICILNNLTLFQRYLITFFVSRNFLVIHTLIPLEPSKITNCIGYVRTIVNMCIHKASGIRHQRVKNRVTTIQKLFTMALI